MKLLLDMNLPPIWVGFLEENGFEAVHWSTAGEPTATDAVIMAWAREHGFVVIRTQDVLPDAIGSGVLRVLHEHTAALDQGAIISMDELTSRVRVLPIRKG